MNNLYKYTYSIHFLLADFSISSSIILSLELFFLLNEPDKITTRGNLLHSPDRVILEEKKEKKKTFIVFCSAWFRRRKHTWDYEDRYETSIPALFREKS